MAATSAHMRRAGPGRGWYGVIVTVIVVTVVVTAVVGYGRAIDLMDEVDGFQRFNGSESASVLVVAPGRHAVYHEHIDATAGDASASAGPASEFVITVTGPDGLDVPVAPSTVTYGWGSRQAEAVGSFDARQPGEYRIEATGDVGQLAFGRSIPGAPLYGFAGVLLLAGAVLAACLLASVVVALRRRAARFGAASSGDGPARTPVPVVVGVVALVIGAVVVALWSDDGSPDPVGMVSGAPSQSTTTLECVSDADFETGLCGTSPEELRDMNLSYADRLEFTGDIHAATNVATQVRLALEPLAPTVPAPSADQVAGALTAVSADVVVSTNAVRTAGIAFGLAVEGGCVFGAVHDGAVEVEIGGYVKDGGCLASYGH